MAIQRVRSKWSKTKTLMKAYDLRAYIPLTKRYNRESLRSMMEQFDMVYIKPDSGTYGKGVIRLEKAAEPESGYRYQIKKVNRHVASLDEVYRALQSYTSTKGYLIQRGVYLLKHTGRRFDIRVMVQRNLKNQWETTGIIGRLAHPERIVTNYHSGGTIKTFEKLMAKHCNSAEIAAYKRRLENLGVSIGKQLATDYPGLKELGVDVAIDTKLHPWVLEVNTKPHPYVFSWMSDKRVYDRVRRYSLAYGGMKKK
ncbi:YheC/YheD family protein [Paenibacillus chungangensis]|uniref:YheC/YheD family protein n=1 Tax=Paenibacillus chungangensis TaxID=696535 RepID=A0ABW3HW87_9BACL